MYGWWNSISHYIYGDDLVTFMELMGDFDGILLGDRILTNRNGDLASENGDFTSKNSDFYGISWWLMGIYWWFL